MRQAVVVSDHSVAVEDVPDPRPGRGEVLVQPRFAGICGSDVHIFEGRHPGAVRPVILGHECTGVVVEAPDGSPVPGTAVGIIPLFGCGDCAHCRLGEPYICVRREVMGIQRPGCLSELLVVPTANVLPLPDTQDLALLSLFEPLAVAIHAVELAEPSAGQHAIIVGGGNIGLLVATYLRHELGVRPSVIDTNPSRVQLARELGFEAAGAPRELDLSREPSRPLAFDCVGQAESADVILDIVPAPRLAVLVGTYPSDATVSLARLKRWEVRVVGSQIYTREDMERALAVLCSPTAAAYRALQVEQQFELAEIGVALETAGSARGGTKVVVRIDRRVERST